MKGISMFSVFSVFSSWFSVREFRSHQLFKCPQGGALRVNHVFDLQVERLFQLMLPGGGGVRRLVGKRNPGCASRKVKMTLPAGALAIPIAFHPIVQLQHVMVICGATGACDSQQLKDGGRTGKRRTQS